MIGKIGLLCRFGWYDWLFWGKVGREGVEGEHEGAVDGVDETHAGW